MFLSVEGYETETNNKNMIMFAKLIPNWISLVNFPTTNQRQLGQYWAKLWSRRWSESIMPGPLEISFYSSDILKVLNFSFVYKYCLNINTE